MKDKESKIRRDVKNKVRGDIKNKELLNMNSLLGTLFGLKGVKFAYAIAKNIRLIQAEVKLLEEAKSEKYKEYDNKRLELAKKHAQKDAQGNSLIINNSYILENQEVFDAELEVLKKKYEAEIKEYEDLLDTENELKLHKIKLSDVPVDITTGQMLVIENLVEEDK